MTNHFDCNRIRIRSQPFMSNHDQLCEVLNAHTNQKSLYCNCCIITPTWPLKRPPPSEFARTAARVLDLKVLETISKPVCSPPRSSSRTESMKPVLRKHGTFPPQPLVRQSLYTFSHFITQREIEFGPRLPKLRSVHTRGGSSTTGPSTCYSRKSKFT